MFRPCKNHEYLIKIFREFHKLKNNSLLLLIGEGKTRKSIEKLVCNYNLEKNVLFLGVRENVSEYLAASDYFIFPSKSEGLPLALIEAQASGIPCFVSDALTRESNLWGLVNYLSIKSAPQVWVKKIINHKQPTADSREKAYRQIPGFGYDIETEACELENFYLEIITVGKT